MIPNPDLSSIPVARERGFEFGSGASQPLPTTDTSFITGAGDRLAVGREDRRRQNAECQLWPYFRCAEIWHARSLDPQNGGGGWDHPIHIHFEEGQILSRTVGAQFTVPAWEQGRKDVYRLRPGGSVTITMQFRDWGGMFMEHCHNTVHEDNAMLVRWEIDAVERRSCLRFQPRSATAGVTFIASG